MQTDILNHFRSMSRLLSFILISVMTLSVLSCDDEEVSPPTIGSINPTQGEVGTAVTITGTNLADATEVKFNGTVATITSKSSTSIVTSVPAGATTGKVTVRTPGGEATSSADFTVVIPVPEIASFAPLVGEAGSLVTITGVNLADVTSVKFNGTEATINSKTTTSIVTTVPANATTGKITVTSVLGTATSASDFTVSIPAPVVLSFSPDAAEAGEEVTITGLNLDQVTAVSFNGTEATITSKNATTIVTTVPAGATTGKLSLTNATGTTEAVTSFAVGTMESILVSNFDEDDADAIWGKAEDAGEIITSAIETENENAFFHLKAKDANVNHWVGGRYFEVSPDSPLGVTESDKTQVWMNVDVKSNGGMGVGKMVYTVVETGAQDNRRNYERDFDVDWTEWKTISIRVDKFGFWNGTGMTDAVTGNADIPTVWSVALFVKGGNGTDTYDLSFDNLRFSEGGPLGEEVEGHH